LRSDVAAEADGVLLRFNADSGANYDYQQLLANNATLSGLATRATASSLISSIDAASSRASNFSPGIIFVPFYKETNAEKWAIGFSGLFGNVSADADLFVVWRILRWRNTATITSLTLLPSTGPNFVSGSKVNLYGIG